MKTIVLLVLIALILLSLGQCSNDEKPCDRVQTMHFTPQKPDGEIQWTCNGS